MSEKILTEKYEKNQCIRIVIDKELIKEKLKEKIELVHLIATIRNRIQITPLYGGNLNSEGKYEMILTFASENINIDPYTKEVRIKKLK